jgi:hypothetical protein
MKKKWGETEVSFRKRKELEEKKYQHEYQENKKKIV